MFPSVTPEYLDDDLIGTGATAADDNFDVDHELYRHIRELNELRAEHPTLVTGAQILHATDGGVFAFSRFDRDERIEYVVIVNASISSVTTTVATLTGATRFEPLRSDGSAVESTSDGEFTVDLPGLTTVVLRAVAEHPTPATPPAISLTRSIR